MSTNRFAKHIGLPRAETLYQIERGNNGLSRKLAETIVSHFPEVSITWLLTGSGEMLHSMADNSAKIAYYDLDVERHIRAIDEFEPDIHIVLPNCVESDLAMVYRGGAMTEMIPANSVVALKECRAEQIVYGKEYLVVTPTISLLRIIRSDETAGAIRLTASRSKSLDDIIIPIDSIDKLYCVTAKLIVNY